MNRVLSILLTSVLPVMLSMAFLGELLAELQLGDSGGKDCSAVKACAVRVSISQM